MAPSKYSHICANCGREFAAHKGRKYCSSACYHRAQVTQVARNCEQCGAEYTARPNRPSRFCSQACKSASEQARVERLCQHCGKAFVVVRSRLPNANYCSYTCRAKAKNPLLNPPRVAVTCAQCGTVFLSQAHENKKFCSRHCQFLAQRRQVLGTCEYCGATYTCIPYHAKTRRFCSKPCNLAANRAIHAQQRGTSAKPKTARRYNALYVRMTRQVRLRDGYRCQQCGKQFRRGDRGLEVDHRVPVRSGGQHTLENLWCLCVPCHRQKDRDLRLQDGLPLPRRWQT